MTLNKETNKLAYNILVHILDDDEDITEEIGDLLAKNDITDYQIHTNPDEFLESGEKVDVCVLDFRFTGSTLTAMEIAQKLIERNRQCKIIVITIMPDLNTYIKLSNIGVWKYLDKTDPLFHDDLITYVKNAIEIIVYDTKIYETLINKLDRRK